MLVHSSSSTNSPMRSCSDRKGISSNEENTVKSKQCSNSNSSMSFRLDKE